MTVTVRDLDYYQVFCVECLLSLYMTVTVRDLNYYQESEYLELTISSWKVGFLA